MNREKITFVASLPPIASAIMTDGTGDSMTIKLQIPLNQCPQALRLNLMTQKILRVTVQEAAPKKVKPAPKPVDKAKEARHWHPRNEAKKQNPGHQNQPKKRRSP